MKHPAKSKRSKQWPAVRRKWLKLHPVCRACGCTVLAELEVHHRRPFHLFPHLELSERNLITLCERKGESGCHLAVGHGGSWKKYNPRVCADADANFRKVKASRVS